MKLIDLSNLVINKRFNKRKNRRLRPVRTNHADELWYKAELLKIVKYTHGLLKQKQLCEKSGCDLMSVQDSWRFDVDQWVDDVARYMGSLQLRAERLAEMAADKVLSSVDQRLTRSVKESIGVDVRPYFSNSGPIKQKMDVAIAANIALIKSIPEQHLSKVKEAVVAGFENGLRWEEMTPVINHVYEITENRAKLIARDQTSKMNSSFNEVRQQTLGIDSYIWETAGDERVRDTHAVNDGKRFRWDNPPAETGHPGEDINCRCVALPYFDLPEVDSYAD